MASSRGSGAEWSEGAAVWFQPPGASAPLPGEVLEVHRAAKVLLVSALVNGQMILIAIIIMKWSTWPIGGPSVQ
ncbi:unnamed protein product [Leptidea sinapis]|uniref:Uncharacterized protein n=1 Tax=Leptidea sinapis TaxID=189913 RepID=A0A5E4PKU5_9NEOP|nr:unnamed protein product [Leptidea sinapis]